jgi:hypothetical protein
VVCQEFWLSGIMADTQTYRKQDDIVSLLLFLQNKTSRLKTVIHLHKYVQDTDYMNFHIYLVTKYNWANVSLGDINTWTWSSRSGVGHKADSIVL